MSLQWKRVVTVSPNGRKDRKEQYNIAEGVKTVRGLRKGHTEKASQLSLGQSLWDPKPVKRKAQIRDQAC